MGVHNPGLRARGGGLVHGVTFIADDGMRFGPFRPKNGTGSFLAFATTTIVAFEWRGQLHAIEPPRRLLEDETITVTLPPRVPT